MSVRVPLLTALRPPWPIARPRAAGLEGSATGFWSPSLPSVEVEAALLEHPLVLEAAVVGIPHPVLGQAVVAVVRVAAEVAPAALLRHCARLLAPGHRPSRVVIRPELPVDDGGKVLKRLLRAELAAAGPADEQVEPGREIDSLVLDVWQEVLGLGVVRPTDSFLALGGHSLLATTAALTLGERLGVEVPLELVLEANTAQELAAALRSAIAKGRLSPPRPSRWRGPGPGRTTH